MSQSYVKKPGYPTTHAASLDGLGVLSGERAAPQQPASDTPTSIADGWSEKSLAVLLAEIDYVLWAANGFAELHHGANHSIALQTGKAMLNLRHWLARAALSSSAEGAATTADAAQGQAQGEAE